MDRKGGGWTEGLLGWVKWLQFYRQAGRLSLGLSLSLSFSQSLFFSFQKHKDDKGKSGGSVCAVHINTKFFWLITFILSLWKWSLPGWPRPHPQGTSDNLNSVHRSKRAPETCRIEAKQCRGCSSGSRWPNTLLTHGMHMGCWVCVECHLSVFTDSYFIISSLQYSYKNLYSKYFSLFRTHENSLLSLTLGSTFTIGFTNELRRSQCYRNTNANLEICCLFSDCQDWQEC